MILSSHAIVGTAAATIFRANPVLAFTAAFASHFLMDAIPHWDYDMHMWKRNPVTRTITGVHTDKRMLAGIAKTGIDAFVGFFISALVVFAYSPELWYVVFLGSLGGVLPDFLQLVYHVTKKQPWVSLQRFHVWIHSKIRLKDRPLIGITTQVVAVSFALMIIHYTLSNGIHL